MFIIDQNFKNMESLELFWWLSKNFKGELGEVSCKPAIKDNSFTKRTFECGNASRAVYVVTLAPVGYLSHLVGLGNFPHTQPHYIHHGEFRVSKTS